MHHGCVFLIAADGREGKVQIAVDLTSQPVQVLSRRHLGDLPLSHIFLQPVNKFAYGGAVLPVYLFHVGKLHLMLNGLHQLGGILSLHRFSLLLQRTGKGIAGVRDVKQPRFLLFSLLQEGNDLTVGKKRHPVF